MAARAAYRVRSISLPARTHPLTHSVEAHLDRLRSSQEASALNRLSDLKNLYEAIVDLLQLPQTQKDLSSDQHRKSVDETLDGSLRLIDLCSTTRDLFSEMRECLKELESSLRRRKGRELSLSNEVEAYMTSRKKLNKVIRRCLKNLKTEKKNQKNSNSVAVFSLLKEVEQISVAGFESLLSMISLPKAKLIWSEISKFVQSKHQEIDTSEVKKIDDELVALKLSKEINQAQIQNLLKGLMFLESTLQEAEEELDCAYRQLLKARVSILNIDNN